MAFTKTIDPPIDSTIEEETITFDFGPDVASGVSITAIKELICSVASGSQGTDSNPSSRLLNGGVIVNSPTTGYASCAVAVLVGTMIGGVSYLIQCVVNTSDGQQLSLWCYAPCITPE